jgi:hypothetical protein
MEIRPVDMVAIVEQTSHGDREKASAAASATAQKRQDTDGTGVHGARHTGGRPASED